MKDYPILDDILIDNGSLTPKYLQVANAIKEAVCKEKVKLNDALPSINELSFSLDISRDTAEKSYRHLKQIGVLASVPGKGFYVKSTEVEKERKVFFLFNKLSEQKKVIYDAFLETIGDRATIDFYVYNNDFASFKKLLLTRRDDYTHFVIIAMFSRDVMNVHEIINTIPKEKLILFDKLVPGVEGRYGAVYENFEKDIFAALEKMIDRISKYKAIKIIYPEGSYYPVEIVRGVKRFCQYHAFDFRVVHSVEKERIRQGDVFINILEDDLIVLSERIMSAGLTVGRQVGVISYNEIPYKKVFLNGITTVSADFQFMGRQAARMILENSREHIESPFHVNLRNSL